jgi:hypothetical protein
MIFATIATRIMLKTTSLLDGVKKIDMDWNMYSTAVIPIGLLFSLSLIFSNYAYLHLSVAFIQMIKAVTPVVVLLVSWALRTAKPDFAVFANVLIIVLGVMIACFGEIKFVLIGFLYQCLGVLFEATRLVMVQKLLSGNKMDPLTSLYYFAPVCAFFNLIAFVFVEANQVTVQHFVDVGLWHFITNALCALGLNVAVVFLVSVFVVA